jgi:membrane protein YdbS with pleckstrin-like domain
VQVAAPPTDEFRPSSRYRLKIRWLAYPFVAVGALLLILLSWAFTIDNGIPEWLALTLSILILLVAASSVAFTEVWISSIWYELRTNDLLVHKGIIIQTLKVVPLRNVTNIATKRDIFDRWFFRLGSLEVQTAGSSGGTAAEEVLVGLGEWQSIYDRVMAALAVFRRQAMTATAVTSPEQDGQDADMSDVLSELRAIRRVLEENSRQI